MIDEKKLIEELESMPYIHGRYDHENGNADFINGIETWHEMVLQKIKSQPKIGCWIPVAERLPKVPEGIEDEYCPEFNVMIKGFSRATTLKCASDGTWFDEYGNTYLVVAWMPLPEAPKQPEWKESMMRKFLGKKE